MTWSYFPKHCGVMTRQELQSSPGDLTPRHCRSTTGQIYMQAPQLRQISLAIRKGVTTSLFWPLPTKPMAPLPICSAHILTHNPHRMQSSFSILNLTCSNPICEAKSCKVLELGHLASKSSSISFRPFITFSECVFTFIPSLTG